MFSQFLKKKIGELSFSPLSLFFAFAFVGSFFLFGKSNTKTVEVSQTPEKKSNGWFKLTHVGNPRLLEILAKKEQIERDLTMFQSVANATVALSLPTEEEPHITPQLSVILAFHKDEPCSSSLLLSILDYLSSSVPGLTKEHITLSDNLGNIYSPIDHTNSLLLSACEGYLGKIFPKEHFALAYVGQEQTPTLQLTINEKYLAKFPKEKREVFLSHAKEHLKNICGENHPIVIEKFPFSGSIKKDQLPYKILVGGTILLSSLGIITLASFYLAFYAYEHLPSETRKIKQGVNIGKLVEILQKETPEKIGLILSYLDDKKAEEILVQLPKEIQNRIPKP